MRRPIEYKAGDLVSPIPFFWDTRKPAPVGTVKRATLDPESGEQVVAVRWPDGCPLHDKFHNRNLQRAR